MGNLVKFGNYDLEAAAQEKEELDASGSGADFMQLKVGRNVVRILPPPVGRRTPFQVVHQHFIKLPGADKPATFVCPRIMQKKACPACAKADQLKGTGNPADADLASELFARRRVFCNVIDRAEPEKGPRIIGFGKTVHEQLLALRQDEDAGGDYTHPEHGFDVIIERTGSTKNDTKYAVRPARNSTPLASTPEQMQDWIDTQRPLDRLATPPSPEELSKIFTSEPSDDAPRTAMVGRPRPSGGPAATKPRGRTAQDDIDTEGEEVS